MNLHGIVSGAIGTVNPMIFATVASSTGYTTPDVPIQVQALTGKEIERLNNLGIQGVLRAVYLTGSANGIVRKYGEGGDLLTFNGQTWLATTVLESWPAWTKLAVTLQMD
jgi:hypothetical protein